MHLVLASMLMVVPVAEDDTHLRMVATGAEAEVVWWLDGHEIGTTVSGQALTVPLAEGRHELHARTEVNGPWEIMARIDPREGGISYVHAWTAKHDPSHPAQQAALQIPGWAWPLAVGTIGGLILITPTRRSKGP